jgi:hypothetical protein
MLDSRQAAKEGPSHPEQYILTFCVFVRQLWFQVFQFVSVSGEFPQLAFHESKSQMSLKNPKLET